VPSTFQSLAVVLVALLPGGLFIWAVERLHGRYGIGFSDRLLRFIGVSVVLHVFAAPATYRLWHDYLRTGALPHGRVLPLWLWPVAAAYVFVPIGLGTILGWALNKWDLPQIISGTNPAPTAWDHLLYGNPDAWIRLKLKSGTWVGGAYAEGSYAGGYPEPADIYVAEAVAVDPETGEFERNKAGNPAFKGYGFLVRWDEIELLDFARR
jgi:Family of unknown function (DUF6338)